MAKWDEGGGDEDSDDDLVNCPECGNRVQRKFLRPLPQAGGTLTGADSPLFFDPALSEVPEEYIERERLACTQCLGELADLPESPSAN